MVSRSYPEIPLEGAVVLVTGGGRGIGRATAEAFVRRGSRVAIGDIDDGAANEAARDLGPRVRAFPLDTTNRAAFTRFVEQASNELGPVDVLVNNAGVMPLGAFLDGDERVDRWTMDVNVWGLVHRMRSVLPTMIARGRGHVVNVASMAGKLVVPGMAMYNASKFAAVGLSAAVRREIRGSGVSVSTVLPGAVRTGLASGVPLGRGLPTVDPEDVAAAIVETCRTRRAERTVPRLLAGWGLLDTLVPERVMAALRDRLDDRRAITSVNAEERRDYTDRVERHVLSGDPLRPTRNVGV
jgi:NADP-dependent 3-hydroxy acid dehydrogenase YdfG